MTYSFTEKKRIRKSFATRETVLEVPYLLATQLATGNHACPASSAGLTGCFFDDLPDHVAFG